MSQGMLRNLWVNELQELFSAELQLAEALPTMAQAARSPHLRRGLQEHLQQTRAHVERLRHLLQNAHASPEGRKCKAMEGLIEEGCESIMKNYHPETVDAALICTTQKVEHFEMAGYESARTWAEWLGLVDEAEMLQAAQEEASAANAQLTEWAREEINLMVAEYEDVLEYERPLENANPLAQKAIFKKAPRRHWAP